MNNMTKSKSKKANKRPRSRWTPPNFTARAQAAFGGRFSALSLIEELNKTGGR